MFQLPKWTPEQWEACDREKERQTEELTKQLQPPALDNYHLLEWSLEAVRWQAIMPSSYCDVKLETCFYPTARGIVTLLDVKPTRVRNSVNRFSEKRFNGRSYLPTMLKPVSESMPIRVIHPDDLLPILVDLAERKPRVQKAIDIVVAIRDRWYETEFSKSSLSLKHFLSQRIDYRSTTITNYL